MQVFVELEIPHIYHSVARNSPKRQELIDKWDVFQVPYIEVSLELELDMLLASYCTLRTAACLSL